MKEQYMGKEGKTIKNGDEVEITFYSHVEPLCSVIGFARNDYLYIQDGCIPLDKSQIFCTEIRIVSAREVK